METWVEEIEGWETRPFSGGYAGLHDLVDGEFSGVVSAGGAWLFAVNGRVVGVVEYRQTTAGDEVTDANIDRFADADGTVYVAPHPSVPLLVAMKVTDGETRGKYYTEDTSLEDVHETLTEGGFTGYLELSENVLSGDYYVVYQAGRSMELAFVGNARRLVTDDDAFERAADEVGIYQVTAVDLDVVDVPEPDPDDESGTTVAATGADEEPTAEAASGTAEADAGTPADEAEGTTGADDGEGTTGADDGPATAAGAGDETDVGPGRDERASGTDGADSTGSPEASVSEPTDVGRASRPEDVESSPEPDADAEEAASAAATSDDSSTRAESDATGTESPDSASDANGSSSAAAANGPSDAAANPSSGSETAEGAAVGAAADSEGTAAADRFVTRSIPSLDPERTGTGKNGPTRHGDGDTARSVDAGGAGATTDERVDELREELAERDRELDERERELADLREELESIAAERDELAQTVDELRARLEELEADREDAPNHASATADAVGDANLTPAEAYVGTNLFVRYGSKGECTLDDVHGGDGTRQALAENLRIEHHTQFEDDSATVADRPFGEWLGDTQEYRFVEWLVGQLAFEIRETGTVEGLRDLYDALPAIDRIELKASVELDDREEERQFGLVARDRMGQPLVVANLDESRTPVTQGAMGSLVSDANEVCERNETLSGAFFVAASFFEPDALEAAREATSDGLLSRDRRRSYVKLSRRRGFHLALVEARDDSFHLSVPDL